MTEGVTAGPGRIREGVALTTGRLLARNTAFNLGAGGLVLLLQIVFVPLMLHAFGMELYGVLAITWMVINHLRWLDLGFSAACAKFVSQDVAVGRTRSAGLWSWSALFVQAAVGVGVAAAVWALAPWLAGLLRTSPETTALVVFTLRGFALVIPLDLVARTMAGVMEGLQRFDWVNLVHVGVTLGTFAAYGAGILAGGSLPVLVVAMIAVKVLHAGGSFLAVVRLLPSVGEVSAHRLRLAASWRRVRTMLGFGGWVSVSAAIGPALMFFDRWVIGALAGVALLPYYAVPFSVMLSLYLIPTSLTMALFPAFSALGAQRRWAEADGFFADAHRYLLLGLTPVIFVLGVWAPQILGLWIGEGFAAEAALPLRILLIGFAIGLFAPICGAILQGGGRPDVIAKIYLVELPLNAAATILLIHLWGIPGAALSFVLRTVLETGVLWWAVFRVFSLSWRRWAAALLAPGQLALIAAVAAIGIAISHAGMELGTGIAVGTLTLLAFAAIAYRFLLSPPERAAGRDVIAALVRRLRSAG